MKITKDVRLNEQQRRRLTPHIQRFQSYVRSEQFREDQAQRLSHVKFFQEELPERLPQFSEADLGEIVNKLWASRIWGNKQYHVQTIIADNGLDKLRTELTHLLDRSKSAGERYERFLQGIKRLGPASVTEILCYNEPDRCGIWNRRAREAFKILGLDDQVDPEKYRLSGAEYEKFNAVLQALAEELRRAEWALKAPAAKAVFRDVDLLFVDFFLYEVSRSRPEKPPTEFDHDEIRDLISTIGEMLGFESQTELRIAHGAQVDVVWRARIGNLGVVTYVFEVHRSGTIDSLLLNLQKARSNPTVQKVIAVSDEGRLEQIKKETEGLPEEFRKALSFWLVSEVQKVAENLQAVDEIIDRLGLVHRSRSDT
jgi:hypothetical protein